MNNKKIKTALSTSLCIVMLLVSYVFPQYKSFAENAPDDNSQINYALPSKGASYHIKNIEATGEENDPSFYEPYVDNDNTKLTDGVTAVGENENSSVTFAGTGKTHIIYFDLGCERKINKIIIRNVICKGGYAGFFDYRSIWNVRSDDKDIETEYSEEMLDGNISANCILSFDDITARYISVTAVSFRYLLTMDEIEIYGEAEPNTTQISGDVNGDNEIDSLDATSSLKYDAGMAELDAAQFAAADVNGDGEVDSLDATMILKYDAGIIDEL